MALHTELPIYRTGVRCHRMTERRMLKIMHGIRQVHDVEVMAP